MSLVLLVLGAAFIAFLIGRYIPLPKDAGHFDSGFTEDGHRLLSDVVRDDPRWDKK